MSPRDVGARGGAAGVVPRRAGTVPSATGCASAAVGEQLGRAADRDSSVKCGVLKSRAEPPRLALELVSRLVTLPDAEVSGMPIVLTWPQIPAAALAVYTEPRTDSGCSSGRVHSAVDGGESRGVFRSHRSYDLRQHLWQASASCPSDYSRWARFYE